MSRVILNPRRCSYKVFRDGSNGPMKVGPCPRLLTERGVNSQSGVGKEATWTVVTHRRTPIHMN